MKNYLPPLLVLLCIHLHAQEKKPVPIFTGLYAPYATQPGIKVGAAFNLRGWEVENRDEVSSRSLYLSPQFGLFRRLSNHTSYVLNTDVGYRQSGNEPKLYAAASLGLGYLMENQRLSATVDLSNGNITHKDKELSTYFLPTLNAEFGKDRIRKTGWYTKLSYGRKISSQKENSGFFAFEFGIRMLLGKTTDSTPRASNR